MNRNTSREKSLLKSSLFNLIKALNGIIFPVITFSYSSRVLGVEGVGRVNVAKSFIAYFTMIALLGMKYYGTREAVRVKDDKAALNRFCAEMLLINGVTTLLAYGLLAAAMFLIPMLRGYETLLLISSAAIVLQGMGLEWLYQALEEFRYIALRSTLFQGIALIAMFVFVRGPDDVVPYAVVWLLASSGSYVLNFINARKYIRLDRGARYSVKKHLGPLSVLFAMTLSIEIYTVLDTTMLAFLKGDAAVGLYSAAIKAERVVDTLLFALCAVMLPRLSYYFGNGETVQARQLIKKAYNYIFMLSIPAAVGLFVLSDEIILLLSGGAFAPAGLTMRLLAPIVALIPFSYITNQQILIPMRRDALILTSTCVGAATDFILNLLWIPLYGENGAAAATLLAEAAVAAVCFVNGARHFQVERVFGEYWQYWLAALPIPCFAFFFRKLSLPLAVFTVSVMVSSATGYALVLFIFKNSCALEVFAFAKERFFGLIRGENHAR